MNFTFSPELTRYGQELRAWSVEVGRGHARQADVEHSIPSNAGELMDTCPVPLGRPDKPGDEFPDFPDGPGARGIVWHEGVAFGDVWIFEALTRGISHLVVNAIGTPEQRRRWYEPMVNGGNTGFGMSEPGAGSDTSRVATTVRRDRDSWVINGTKMFCSLGAIAEYILVFATIDKTLGRDGIRAIVVPQGTPGMVAVKRNEDKLGYRSWVTTQLAFEDCAVPLDHMLGWTPDGGLAGAPNGLTAGLGGLNDNRPNVSSMGIGVGRAALGEATRELKTRKGEFSARRWQVVEGDLQRMERALDRGTNLNLYAQLLKEQGRDNRLEASAAKAYGPATAERVIRRCIQLLGPDGASTKLLLEKWYRDIKIVDIFEGTGQILRMVVARQLQGPNGV